VAELQTDDPAAIERSISYLESDPWEFRSGYLKGRLLHHLANRSLDEGQRRRLRGVLLVHCDAGHRFEFDQACRLARRQDVPGLRHALAARLSAPDPAVAVRSLRMLLSTRRPKLSPTERALARHALVRWAGQVEPRMWSSRWVALTTERLWPVDAPDALQALTASDDPIERFGARFLLTALQQHRRRRSSRHGSSAMP